MPLVSNSSPLIALEQIAAQLKIPIIGTAGVLLLAKDRQLIAAVKPCLDALIEHRFFLARAVYELILNRAGES